MILNYNKKGVSGLITIILLIVVAVVIIGIILSWGKSFTLNRNSEISSSSEEFLEENTSSFLKLNGTLLTNIDYNYNNILKRF